MTWSNWIGVVVREEEEILTLGGWLRLVRRSVPAAVVAVVVRLVRALVEVLPRFRVLTTTLTLLLA